MNTQHNYCVILAGGIGRRLWPCSHRAKPKQFVDFFGIGRTLLQQTYDRFRRFMDDDHIYVSTFTDYAGYVREQLPQIAEDHILAEPVQLSTAPAAAWASCHIGMSDPDACVIVTPSDHHIVSEERFREQVEAGFEYIGGHDDFLALGARPTVPNTAYGYIQMGNEGEGEQTFRVKSFSEKPAPEYAKMFVESGEFAWNTGIFLWNVRTMFRLLRTKDTLLSGRLEEGGQRPTTAEELDIIKQIYPASLHITIDTLILEKCDNVFVRPCDFGWTDVGSWPELFEAAPKDADGNAVLTRGRVSLSGCRGNVVALPDDCAAIIRGLEGYLVAQNGNRLIICPNDDPAIVRRLANEAQMRLGDDFA